MIIAERKPFEEIKGLLGDAQKILVIGCGTCVAVCLAGGEKEAGILAQELDLAYKVAGQKRQVDSTCVERQCDMEFLEPLDPLMDQYDAYISMACGIGVQFLSDRHPSKIILPGVNTTFAGANLEVGLWEEKCRLCGECVLGRTGGVCPNTRCAKRLQNGPCGGTMPGGKCEISPDQPCAWYQIWERLSAQGRLDLIEELAPIRDHRAAQPPAKQVHPAYQKRYTAQV